MHFVLARKIDFNRLSERNMGIDYIYNFIDHENPL